MVYLVKRLGQDVNLFVLYCRKYLAGSESFLISSWMFEPVWVLQIISIEQFLYTFTFVSLGRV